MKMRGHLCVSSIDAIPDSAGEKTDKESDREYSRECHSNEYVFNSNMLDHKNDDTPPQY